jgi:hypothetical protein
MWMPPYERRADEDTAGIGADNNEGCDKSGYVEQARVPERVS